MQRTVICKKPKILPPSDMSPMDFHHGQALLRVAGHYPTLSDVIFEGVQNALDEGATVIRILLNQAKRFLIIQDNGEGTSRSKFEKALTSVCNSIKAVDDLGQFGMGLISPLGKCRFYTFTSTPKANPRNYSQWTFSTEDIKKQEKIKGIPIQPMPDMLFDKSGKNKGGVPWRTQIRMVDLIKDRVLTKTSISFLQEGVLERYSEKMKKLSTTVYIDFINKDGTVEAKSFMAAQYNGTKLPEKIVSEKDSGKTVFRLYIANKTAKGRNGKVVVGKILKDFRIGFKQFAQQVSGYLDHRASEALNSGLFEGEIVCEKIDIDPDRKKFSLNDSLVGFCIAVDKWFNEIGYDYVEQANDEAIDERYQRIGLRSLRVLEALLKNPAYSHLQEVVSSFSCGTIGIRHAEPKAKVIGSQEYPSIATIGDEKKNSEGSMSPGREADYTPLREHEQHQPFTSGGSRGRRRSIVKNNSIGLQFVYEEMPGSEKIWELDTHKGILSFNVKHPCWEECESNERTLMKYQEQIAIMALSLETVPLEQRELHRKLLSDMVGPQVFLICHGDELSHKKTLSPRKKK